MKRLLIIIVLVVSVFSTSFSQVVVNNSKALDEYNEIPQERIFVHYNSSLMFSGEYLYYRIYCFNSQTNQLSDFSKIAYIELIGENKQSVFKHKVTLTQGLGQGDFFIPTTVASGNYKLIAYTQWMLNGEGADFFNADISIINPYLGDQKSIMATKNNSTEGALNELETDKKEYTSHNVFLSTDADRFGNREKVTIQLKPNSQIAAKGNFSLSVRKIDKINNISKLNANNYTSGLAKNTKNKIKNIGDPIYLPEIRGEIIIGKVLSKDNNQPVSGKKVAISIPGKDFIFKMSNTNNEGVFIFQLNQEYENKNAIIQVLGDDKDQFKLEIDGPASADLSNLKFNQFKITPAIKDLILERSIYNQIENSYFSIKPDSVLTSPEKPTFYFGELATTYILEDYTRFPTVKEILVEIVDNVWTVSNNEGVFVKLRGYGVSDKESLPLILMDGVLIQNHDHLLEYNAAKIDKISVLRNKFYFGSQIFQGILFIETKDGDFENKLYGDFISKVELFKPQQEIKYFKQTYSNNEKDNSSRIPDYRSQLLWIPNINFNSDEISIPFYTSDNSGDYEICLEGFTEKGAPVFIRKIISVE